MRKQVFSIEFNFMTEKKGRGRFEKEKYQSSNKISWVNVVTINLNINYLLIKRKIHKVEKSTFWIEKFSLTSSVLYIFYVVTAFVLFHFIVPLKICKFSKSTTYPNILSLSLFTSLSQINAFVFQLEKERRKSNSIQWTSYHIPLQLPCVCMLSNV
jgi:hypothetical protein